MPASLLIDTPRLQLLATHPGLAEAVAAFYQRNAAHFATWDPPLPADHNTLPRVTESLHDGQRAFEAGQGHRWWLSLRESPGEVIGSVHLSNVVRGPFQSCNLGYALDASLQGFGLMHEALRAVLAEAFKLPLNLHRIQAAVRPENLRSLAVLQRLAFRDEGLARDYLFIDGAWRDHRLFAITHPGFVPPEHWHCKDLS